MEIKASEGFVNCWSPYRKCHSRLRWPGCGWEDLWPQESSATVFHACVTVGPKAEGSVGAEQPAPIPSPLISGSACCLSPLPPPCPSTFFSGLAPTSGGICCCLNSLPEGGDYTCSPSGCRKGPKQLCWVVAHRYSRPSLAGAGPGGPVNGDANRPFSGLFCFVLFW